MMIHSCFAKTATFLLGAFKVRVFLRFTERIASRLVKIASKQVSSAKFSYKKALTENNLVSENEKTKSMTPQIPPHEVLLFINTHLTKNESFENRNGNLSHRSAEVGLHTVCWSGLLLQLLSLLLKDHWRKDSEHNWEIIRASHFIEVKLGDACHPIEYTTSVNPYLVSLATNLN
jgi:hypothetical protein